MGTETQARLADMLAEYQATRRKMVALNAQLASMTASARSVDRSVTATVGPRGELVHLTIDPVLGPRLGPKALAGRVLEASGLAAEEVRDRLREALRAGLPPKLRGLIGQDGGVDLRTLLPADPTASPRR